MIKSKRQCRTCADFNEPPYKSFYGWCLKINTVKWAQDKMPCHTPRKKGAK